MIIEKVTAENIMGAAEIHAEAWKESHKSFCSPAFVERHTPERQKKYLEEEMKADKQLFMLTDDKPAGIVSIKENLIENLYVHPELQRRGYGSLLLEYAIKQCAGTPVLWVLNNNSAKEMYKKAGFKETGVINKHSDSLWEIEMILE